MLSNALSNTKFIKNEQIVVEDDIFLPRAREEYFTVDTSRSIVALRKIYTLRYTHTCSTCVCVCCKIRRCCAQHLTLAWHIYCAPAREGVCGGNWQREHRRKEEKEEESQRKNEVALMQF